MSDKMSIFQNPVQVVPVYIKDFLGDYTNVTHETMTKLFNSFELKYRDEMETQESCKILYDAVNIDLIVDESDLEKSTDELLKEINFEGAMKNLPTNRIIKLYLTLFDEKMNIEYRTNGVRIMVDADTNFTQVVQNLVKQSLFGLPEYDTLRLVKLRIRGGLAALACDDHIPPDWVMTFVDTASEASEDSTVEIDKEEL
jgi:hypothetical protein